MPHDTLVVGHGPSPASSIPAKSGFFGLDPSAGTGLVSSSQIRWTHGFVGSGIFVVPDRALVPSDASSSVRRPWFRDSSSG
jgi:hypothetical protein